MSTSSAKFIFVGLILFIFCPILGRGQQPYSPLDEDGGFLGYKLGAKIDTLQKLKPAGSKEYKQLFLPNPPIYSYLNARFDKVEFLFYRDRLHTIRLTIHRKDHAMEMLDLLKLLYGEPKILDLTHNYLWEGQWVKLRFEQELLKGITTVDFISKDVEKIFSREWR